jgi:serine/threonine protein kinase
MQALKSKAIVDHRFEIVEMLGAGGMGIVYKATQLELGRTVALKFLLPHLLEEEQTLARFKIEAEALASLSHRNISLFYAYGVWHDRAPYIAMEYLDAPNLSEVLIHEGGKLTWRRTLEIVHQICDAISHAHSNGIIHRDLKPSNVFVLAEDGSAGRVKVSDFGLAKIINDDDSAKQKLTATGFTLGSPHYMSPEQAQGQPITAATDIYSVGCIMYECLFGRPPFDADSPIEILVQQSSHKLRLPDTSESGDLPQGLVTILETALAKNAVDRFPSMKEMADAIETVIEQSANARDSKSKFSVRRQKESMRRSGIPMVTRATAIALACVFGAGLIVFANLDTLRFAWQDLHLRSARSSHDYYEAAKIEMQEIELCAKTNRSEFKKQLQNQLAVDGVEALKANSFAEISSSRQQEFVAALASALADWTPASGEVIDRLSKILINIQRVDPEYGTLLSVLIVQARKPFYHRADNYTTLTMPMGILILAGGPTINHRKEILTLFEKATGKDVYLAANQMDKQADLVTKQVAAGDVDEAARSILPLFYSYCVGQSEPARVNLYRATQELDRFPLDERTQFASVVLSICNFALSTYYSSASEDEALPFYKRAIANELKSKRYWSFDSRKLAKIIRRCNASTWRFESRTDVL